MRARGQGGGGGGGGWGVGGGVTFQCVHTHHWADF